MILKVEAAENLNFANIDILDIGLNLWSDNVASYS